MPKVNIHHIKNKQLLITGRSHAVIGDQPAEKGRSDVGCTPTELFLSALGSCMPFDLLAIESILATPFSFEVQARSFGRWKRENGKPLSRPSRGSKTR
jgi:hypothetical protein